MPLLDSDFIIDVVRGRSSAVDLLGQMVTQDEDLFVSTITMFEISNGLCRSKAPEKETKLVFSILEYADVIAPNSEISKEAGEISCKLSLTGMKIAPLDCIIGATALTLNQELVTRNHKHFSRIENLQLKTW